MLRTLAARFFQSVSQLTWLPLPAFARERCSPCIGAFPLVGALLGLIAALTFIFALPVLPSSLAVALALSMLLALSGGTAEASVMQSGARAVVAVVVLQLVRLIALLELTEDTVPMALLVALPLAQLAGVATLFALPAAINPSQPALTQPLHPAAISHRGRVVAVAFGVLPLFMLTPAELGQVLGTVALALVLCIGLLRRRRLAQQAGFHFTALVIEVAVYVALNLAWGQPVEEFVL